MLDFPDTPALNAVYSSGGVAWKWDGTRWIHTAMPSSGEVWVGPNAPPDLTPELWYDTDAVPAAFVDLTTQMMINERFVLGQGAGSITSTTYVDIPTAPALTIPAFTKVMADSLVVVTLCASMYTGAVNGFGYGVRIGSTDYVMMDCFSNVASQHDGRAIVRSFSGIAAGTYAVTGRCRVAASTLLGDANDTLSLNIREVRRS